VLVVVPLSTLQHWKREFTSWTDLNVIVYHGSAEDRRFIREFEFAYEQDRPEFSPNSSSSFNGLYLKKCVSGRSKRSNSSDSTDSPWMIQVVITTPEMLVTDDFTELTAVQPWSLLVVDEAHRLKNFSSKLAVNLRDPRFQFQHKILLTGTPIQNDVQEFWTLLNFIAPEQFSDLDEFMAKYGVIKTADRVSELHEEIRPFILRRLKEDVEKSVPPKEETLIEVELTVVQKKYYRALYEKNVGFLLKNKSKALDGPSLNNLAMQLRKVCNHLFLINGAEADFRTDQLAAAAERSLDEGDLLVLASGKLVLLDKLLPRLKEQGHRVLLFSQFKIMLDILEDYFVARKFKFERIDGSITGHRRQQAIDRFQQTPGHTNGSATDERDVGANKVTEPPFIMMLSTRAGGVGINLTAAGKK
jgi:SNF2 family DNA or RNA helicase